MGIHLVDVAPHRMEQLVDVLCEVAAENATNSVKICAEKLAAEEKARKDFAERRVALTAPELSVPASRALEKQPNSRARQVAEEHELSGRTPASLAETSTPKLSGPDRRDRRGQSRHPVDTSATILLVNVSSRLRGRILNLSLGGCRIRTEERFPVGIYTRVEAEFHLEGLPFRLGGVVQAIQDKRHVGVRFLDMSERKREQLLQLIGEIEKSQDSSARLRPAVP